MSVLRTGQFPTIASLLPPRRFEASSLPISLGLWPSAWSESCIVNVVRDASHHRCNDEETPPLQVREHFVHPTPRENAASLIQNEGWVTCLCDLRPLFERRGIGWCPKPWTNVPNRGTGCSEGKVCAASAVSAASYRGYRSLRRRFFVSCCAVLLSSRPAASSKVAASGLSPLAAITRMTTATSSMTLLSVATDVWERTPVDAGALHGVG